MMAKKKIRIMVLTLFFFCKKAISTKLDQFDKSVAFTLCETVKSMSRVARMILALFKYFDQLTDEQILKWNMPAGSALVYELAVFARRFLSKFGK